MRELHFDDYPEFRPNLTPRQIFKMGSFGGTYWRPIDSAVTGKHHANRHLKYDFLQDIPDRLMTKPWEEYDVNINKYGVKVGQTLEAWEKAGWIKKSQPYGWVQWYCDFYNGTRGADDRRQIDRWLALAGPRGRFRLRLINMLKQKKDSPKIRQTLQHWAYKL